MNKKLTLSINEQIIQKVKKYAAKTDQNISSLVENYFSLLVSSDSQEDLSPTGIVAEMAGAFKNIKGSGNYKKEIKSAIQKKYGSK